MSTTIKLNTDSRQQLLDITRQVAEALASTGVQSGVAWVYCPHTTAGITIQENADPDVGHDIITHLERLVPARPDFRHREGNSDAHIKSALMGASQAVLVQGGQLQLGTWQGIYFCEFDGPRSRRVLVKVTADG